MNPDLRMKSCGRIDHHPEHEWVGYDFDIKLRFNCPGHVTVEGGWTAHGKAKS